MFLIVVLMLYEETISALCFADNLNVLYSQTSISKDFKDCKNSHVISSTYEHLSKELNCKDAVGHIARMRVLVI